MPMKLVFPGGDLWDEAKGEFVEVKEQTLSLEHSLISLSKWERKWKKPFLTTDAKTTEEWLDYIKCMTLNPVPDNIYERITSKDVEEILAYIEDPMTATTFSDAAQQTGKREVITSEIIYYNMFSFGIPKEVEKWHLNTLIALIKVFAIKNGGDKKMSRAEAAMYQRSLNERRRAKSHRR